MKRHFHYYLADRKLGKPSQRIPHLFILLYQYLPLCDPDLRMGCSHLDQVFDVLVVLPVGRRDPEKAEWKMQLLYQNFSTSEGSTGIHFS